MKKLRLRVVKELVPVTEVVRDILQKCDDFKKSLVTLPLEVRIAIKRMPFVSKHIYKSFNLIQLCDPGQLFTSLWWWWWFSH